LKAGNYGQVRESGLRVRADRDIDEQARRACNECLANDDVAIAEPDNGLTIDE
jgi:hypothetical protein